MENVVPANAPDGRGKQIAQCSFPDWRAVQTVTRQCKKLATATPVGAGGSCSRASASRTSAAAYEAFRAATGTLRGTRGSIWDGATRLERARSFVAPATVRSR